MILTSLYKVSLLQLQIHLTSFCSVYLVTKLYLYGVQITKLNME